MSSSDSGSGGAGCDSDLAGGWTSNKTASIFSIVSCIIIVAFYGWNVYVTFQAHRKRSDTMQAKTYYQRHKVDISSLSGVVASTLALSVLYAGFATWSQPLEAVALFTVVFAQLSALVWQDHVPDILESDERPREPWHGFKKDMFDRIPDVLAVIVAIITLYYLKGVYDDQHPYNSFYPKHDPKKELIFASVLTGSSFILGLLRELFGSLIKDDGQPNGQANNQNFWSVNARRLYSFVLPIIFSLLQMAIACVTIVYGFTTLAQGLALFNITKGLIFATLLAGAIYSVAATYLDFLFSELRGLYARVPDQFPMDNNPPGINDPERPNAPEVQAVVRQSEETSSSSESLTPKVRD